MSDNHAIDSPGPADLTVGQRGDILMFTTRNAARPFVGRYQLSVDATNPTLQSDVAEVAWFLRGKTLHRRVLLVVPGVAQNAVSPALAKSHVLCQQRYLGPFGERPNRAQQPGRPDQARESLCPSGRSTFPFDARRWGFLGLPTLAECSSPTWMANWINGTTPPARRHTYRIAAQDRHVGQRGLPTPSGVSERLARSVS